MPKQLNEEELLEAVKGVILYCGYMSGDTPCLEVVMSVLKTDFAGQYDVDMAAMVAKNLGIQAVL